MNAREFWCGAVTVTGEGGYPEQLINRASEQDIALWNITRQDYTVRFTCVASQYRRLRPLANKSGVRLRAGHRRGLPFLLRPLRWRWGLLVGALLAWALIGGLSTRIWCVVVRGNDVISETAVCETLEQLGVGTGRSFAEVDIPSVQLQVMTRLPDAAWVGIRERGSVLYVDVREKTPTTENQDTAPANIVADGDGVVVDICVTAGQGMVKPGEAVTKGSLLIGGVMDSEVGPLLRRAAGTVTVRSTVSVSVTVPFTETVVMTNTVPKSGYTLRVFGLSFSLAAPTPPTDAVGETTMQWLTVSGKRLPIGIQTETYTQKTTERVTRTEETAREQAYRQLAEKEEITLEAMTLENRQVTQMVTAEGVTVTAVYTVLREGGVVQPITAEKVQKNAIG